MQSAVASGLSASEWVGAVSGVLGGRGGGKAAAAQATGPNTTRLPDAVACAHEHARARLPTGVAGLDTLADLTLTDK